MDDSWEIEQTTENDVDAYWSIVLAHEVDGERWAHKTKQVSQKVDFIDGKVMENGNWSAKGEDAIDPVFLVTLSVKEDRKAGDDDSKAGFKTGHALYYKFK